MRVFRFKVGVAIAVGMVGWGALCLDAHANGNVHVTRFWHNHQPLYWPEWNSNGWQTERGQYAWDSIVLKPGQNYGGLSPKQHPENNLTDIFGLDDRRNSYQERARDSLNTFSGGGMSMSYSGSLIDNVRQLGAEGQLGYHGGWNNAITEARGSGRLDMLGFTYHHSLGPLLPKEVFRKEIQIFKQAWWKAWGGNADLSDHSKGFFPTEMAYSRDLIDVLVDEGYEWVIVASHHISRTSPSYNNVADPEGSYNIFSSPPNRADQLGPTINDGWWYSEPNPGNAAWNVSPFAYQLHRVKYVNPETGAEKTMIAVPSDDVLSYRYGYANEGIGKIQQFISPFANDPDRPVIVMPSSDGDNAWGGGFSSWMEATPQYFNESANAGYVKNTVQNFVNNFGWAAPETHIEEGAWIFPEMDYGSPYFLKWIEPPVIHPGATNAYPGTVIDMETPGFALKFYSYAPLMAGANWVITAEQIWEDDGGAVEPWKIQAPYDWNGTWNNPNIVELAWHIYLKGLDSGFNYYGGLGNDDEVKPGLAARRAIERLQDWLPERLSDDRTGPTILKPQRFPYNPGWYTFGWFNSIPGVDTRFLKKMPSEFYIWTHVYDVSDVQSVHLKIRRDKDGTRSLANNHNETYAGGSDVDPWVTIPMNQRTLWTDRATLNAMANKPGEIDYFITSPEVADYYFVRITDQNFPGFRGNLFDYYIESVDTRGNTNRTEIQHVWVEDDGLGGAASNVTFSDDPRDCAPLVVTFDAEGGDLESISPVYQQISFDNGTNWNRFEMLNAGGDVWVYTNNVVPDNAPSATVWFENSAGTMTDSNSGNNWSTSIRDCDAPVGPATVEVLPENPSECEPVTIRYYPNEGLLQGETNILIHIGRNGWDDVISPAPAMTQNGIYWEYTYLAETNSAEINFVFNNGGGIWDNNGGDDWNVVMTDCGGPPSPLDTVTLNPATPDGCGPITITYNPSGRDLMGEGRIFIHIGYNGWQDVILPNPEMTASGSYWTYTYTPVPGTTNINLAFNNGGSTWDNNDDADWHFEVLNCDPIPEGLVITNPPSDIAVSNTVTNYDLEGTGLGVTGDIAWTNALTGVSGTIPAAMNWSVPGIALAVGGNAITVRGTNDAITVTHTNAADAASDAAYNDGWNSGNNGGTGFGSWALNASGDVSGHFVASDNPALAIGTRAWGLFAQESALAEARRPFSQPLSSGRTMTMRMQNGLIETGGGIGVAIENAASNVLWQFYFNGGDVYYSRSGGTTDVGWASTGLDLSLEMTSDTNYTLTVTPIGDTPRVYNSSFEPEADQTPAYFRAWSWNNGAGPDYDYFINDLRMTSESNTPVIVSDSVIITRIGDPWATDSNSDGIPDGWYMQYGQNPNGSSIAHLDWDDDGFNNEQEFNLGTDPFNEGSGLILETIVNTINGHPEVVWQSVGGRRYQVEYSDDVTLPGGGFVALGGMVDEDSVDIGDATQRSVTDTDAPAGSTRLYRVRFMGLTP